MKKDIIINMSKLSIGGMEKALIDLINKSNLRRHYNVHLLIGYCDSKNYLNELPNDIDLKLLYKNKWNIFGKFVVFIKLLFNIIFTKKYYASICYTHHHGILSTLTRRQSKNNIIFIHTDLINSRNDLERKKLCQKLKFDKFSKVVCVSEKAKESFLKIYPNYNGIVCVANNYIDDEMIISKSKEKIDLRKDDIVTFLNVSRHDEFHKRVSRIIKASKKLNDDGYKFRVILIGDGKDHNYYDNLIKENDLENVLLIGNVDNPYPYYKIASSFVLSSSFEGYGIVLNEARVLNIPIITTDVADAKLITNDGYGILCDNSDEGIYYGMKQFLDNGYNIKNKFDVNKYNEKITECIDDVIRM